MFESFTVSTRVNQKVSVKSPIKLSLGSSELEHYTEEI